MTTKRALLELAAKACRLRIIDTSPPISLYVASDGRRGGLHWNPLTDDGDCAHMEAQLGIETLWRQDRVGVVYIPAIICKYELFSDHAGDKNAARRAASVAVAAELGRTK